MIKKIYLIHHTHFDQGFTDLPEEVIRQQLSYLDSAVRLCEGNPKYHWTLESASLLRYYMACRPQTAIDQVMKFLRNGQLELAALDMQMLTETASYPELKANATRAANLGTKYGFPVTTAILDDIGGFAGELPLLLNQAGIRYFIAGVGACQAALPWANLPHLFYLNTQAGGRILVWNLGIDRGEPPFQCKRPYSVYGMASIYLCPRTLEQMTGMGDNGYRFRLKEEVNGEPLRSPEEIFSILTERLERENYPYEELFLQYGGDNRSPLPELPRVIDKLNATGKFPEIQLTHSSAFFQTMEEKYGKDIPVINGILNDPWNIRMNGVPSVLKKYRAAQRKYDTARLLGLKEPDLFDNLMMLSDHTFGLNNWGWQAKAKDLEHGIRNAAFDRMRQSWTAKARYAEAATLQASCLETRSERLLELGNEAAIVVKNAAPQTVSAPAEIYLGENSPELLSLKDADGKEIPLQKIGLNRWMLFVENVPGLGCKRLTPKFGSQWNKPLEPMMMPIPAANFKTDFFLCEFSVDGSLLSLADRQFNLIFDTATSAIGALQMEEIYDGDIGNEHCNLKPMTDRRTTFLPGAKGYVTEDGPLFISVTQSGAWKSAKASVTYRLWKHLPRIDFLVRLDKEETTDKTMTRIVFPFFGKDAKFHYDQNLGTVTQDMLLPGSAMEFAFCSRYAAVESAKYTAVLCCPDAPVVEMGGRRAGEWSMDFPFTPISNHICGLIGNNICNTDAPAWYPLFDTFAYSLFITDAPFSPAKSQAFWNSSTALTACYGYAKETCRCQGLDNELRLHSDELGEICLENLTDTEKSYDFTLKGKPYSGKLPPRGIAII